MSHRRKKLNMEYAQKDRLSWRNIDPDASICQVCNGSGVRMYEPNTSWLGDMHINYEVNGKPTSQVCDKCWGSGIENRPAFNLQDAMRFELALHARIRHLEEVLAKTRGLK